MNVGGLVIVTLMLDEHLLKKLLIDNSTHYLKAHRIRTNLISKLPA